jgi:UDP-N-acetyl-D-glucosamine dehydrogenase
MHLLAAQGAELSYHDDHVPEVAELKLSSESLDAALAGSDAAVIVTAHPDLDVARVVESAPLVVDFRGATRGIRAEHLVRL